MNYETPSFGVAFRYVGAKSMPPACKPACNKAGLRF
jgi:hypothetical protein